MGLAGVLAWAEDWTRLAADWVQLLGRENILSPFHMADFVHHAEGFSDSRWKDRSERLRVLQLLLALVETAKVIPVAAAVNLPDFNSLTEDQQKWCRDPYHLAFQVVTSNLGFAVGSKDLSINLEKAREDVEAEREGRPLHDWDYATPARVSMTYARCRGFTGPAEHLWNAIKRFNMFGYWMDRYSVGEPADLPQLQVADIWAYSIGNLGERDESILPEAALALRLFVKLAMTACHGHHWFTRLDRITILARIGSSYIGHTEPR